LSYGDRPTGVTILAILEIILGILYGLVGLLFLVATSFIAEYAYSMLGSMSSSTGAVLLIFALLRFVLAWGFLSGQGWSRIMGLVLAALGALTGLLTLPLGLIDLILNGLIIYYLTRPYVIDYFRGIPSMREAPPPPPP
jgi:hypothetical protein